MKKIFLTSILLTISIFTFAQKQVTIKGGTIVPVEAVKNVRATEVQVGQNVDFRVSRDIIVDGMVAIPSGALVKGVVNKATRSAVFGIPGRLGIKLKYLNLPSGDIVNLGASDIYIVGNYRIAASIAIFCFTCVPLPCGTRAELQTGVEYDAVVSNNTTVIIK